MKYIRVTPAVILVLLWRICLADFFPLGGYQCDRLNQADSCNLNTALFYCDLGCVDSLLDTAEVLGMKVILTRARIPGTPDITYLVMGSNLRISHTLC